jgi:hypothetical protein
MQLPVLRVPKKRGELISSGGLGDSSPLGDSDPGPGQTTLVAVGPSSPFAKAEGAPGRTDEGVLHGASLHFIPPDLSADLAGESSEPAASLSSEGTEGREAASGECNVAPPLTWYRDEEGLEAAHGEGSRGSDEESSEGGEEEGDTNDEESSGGVAWTERESASGSGQTIGSEYGAKRSNRWALLSP